MHTKRIAQALIVAAVSATLASPGGVAWAQNRPVTNFQYDANGNLTSTTDALGRVTSQTYDTLNRLTKITQPKPIGTAPNPVTQFGVNGLDRAYVGDRRPQPRHQLQRHRPGQPDPAGLTRHRH